MNLLIVEDDETHIAFFADALAKPPQVSATFARSRDGALGELAARTFDLVVLDLKLPSTDGALDADTNHGLAVRAALLDKTPGTPVVIYSGFGTIPLLQDLLTAAEKQDIFGNGVPRPMTLFFQKEDLGKCLADIRNVAREYESFGDIEISTGTDPIKLSDDEQKALRIFARTHSGKNIRVASLGGGLSGARTCRVEIEDTHRVTKCYAVVKLGPVREIEREHKGFQKYVSPVLKIAGFAHVICFLNAGAANIGALFYGLAKEHDASLLDLLKTDAASATAIVDRLRKLEEVWQNNAPAKQRLISELRRPMISDDDFLALAGGLPFDWAKLEQTSVNATECTQHCDLHGLNVLLKSRAEPLMIDFGAVGSAPACLDPLILELSLLFHPACRAVCGTWPTEAQAKQWDNLTIYTKDCPFADYVRICRKWAMEVEAGDRAVYATAYCYAVRQFKFKDGNHPIATAVAEAAYSRLISA